VKDATILVIGYGNTLRGDDGVGPAVAVAVAAKQLPGVRVVTMAQLTPELAEPMARARAAVFIDARLDSAASPVSTVRLRPTDVSPPPSHVADPRSLLALAQALFGQAPDAWLVTVAGTDFGLRETLSVEGWQHARVAQEHVECLLRQLDARPAAGA
jgi:hydrogenase maturation protease